MDKLEKHIKQSLDKRQIRPSDEAWSRIESQLDDSKKSNTTFPKMWYAVAAIFIGVVLVTTLYWGPEPQSDTIQAVDVESEDNPEDKEKGINNAFEIESEPIQNMTEKKLVVVEQEPIFKSNVEREIIKQESKKLSLNDDLPEHEQLIIDQKVNEVFAKVAMLESNNEALTNAEVDSLLRAAQNEILADKIFEEDGSVNAMALLNEVEGELFEAERNQLFDRLKESFFKLRTAVADRNK